MVTGKGPFHSWLEKESSRNWATAMESRKIKFNSRTKEMDRRRESLLSASCNTCPSYWERQQGPQTVHPQQTHVLSGHWNSPDFFGWHRVTYWQLSVIPSELGHSGASSFREYNCWEKSSWPDTCKEDRNRRGNISNTEQNFSKLQTMYVYTLAKSKTGECPQRKTWTKLFRIRRRYKPSTVGDGYS